MDAGTAAVDNSKAEMEALAKVADPYIGWGRPLLGIGHADLSWEPRRTIVVVAENG